MRWINLKCVFLVHSLNRLPLLPLLHHGPLSYTFCFWISNLTLGSKLVFSHVCNLLQPPPSIFGLVNKVNVNAICCGLPDILDVVLCIRPISIQLTQLVVLDGAKTRRARALPLFSFFST